MNETEIQRQLARHKATNKALVERIQSRGGSLDEARTVDLTFISPSEHEGKRLILALRALAAKYASSYDGWGTHV